jgi:topoisomerase-4 subunit A
MGELTEVQAEAILNMRLRSLRRLEEMELLRERDALMEERAGSRICWPTMACNGTASPRAARGAQDLRQGLPGGARRTQFAEAGEVEEVPLEAMIDREPVTVVCSQMGWIRAMKGHIDLDRS